MSVSSISNACYQFLAKRLKLFCFLLLAFVFSVFGIFTYQHLWGADRQFNKLCADLSEDFFSADALSLAFVFSDPPACESLLPLYDKETYLKSDDAYSYLNRLSNINADNLCEDNAALYDILVDYFARHSNDGDFLYLENPLSPTGGVQTNLPVLLAEYPVKNKEDIEQYLNILEAIPDYLASLCNYATDRKEQGYLMATDDINEVIAQCDKMCSSDGYALFSEGFANLLAKVDDLSASEKELYTAKCDRIITTMIFPAYEALGDTLLLLREEGVLRLGLYHSGDRDYYAHLLSLKTGSDKSVKEIEAMLQSRFQVLATEFNQLLTLVAATPIDNPDIVSGTPADLLLYLEDSLQESFPALPSQVSSSIHNVPDCLLPYTAPAYYFTPQVDNYWDNSIYINESDITDELSLFTTLAHEGYPGHMLQSTYFLSHEEASVQTTSGGLSVQTRNALRTALNYIGYIEGWAMYVELFSYDYAVGVDGAADEALQNYCKLLRVNRELKICLYCLLDIRIHYYGENAADITPYLVNVGIRDQSSIDAVYAYLVNEPATYASYYVGFLELLECKELYQKYCDKAGIEYTDKNFHEFYLDCGPCSFSYIKQKIPLLF